MGSCCSKWKESRKSKEAEEAAEPEKEKKSRWKRKKKWDDMSLFGGGGGESGRFCFNSSSKVGCLYTQQGKKGTNQDAMLLWENFSSRSDCIFCGVFDGHGPFGHLVAKKVRDSLPLLISTQWKSISSSSSNNQNENPTSPSSPAASTDDDEWSEPLAAQNGSLSQMPDVYVDLRHSMLKAFKLMDKDLRLHSTIDCFCSGTTAVALVKQGEHVVIGNVGDSRAVLATRDTDNALVALQLTVDLKPDLPGLSFLNTYTLSPPLVYPSRDCIVFTYIFLLLGEAARIQRCKGRVFALQDEPEVARVWLPNNDSPGLAMARAFGDFCLKDFGLISVPDVYYHHVTEKDEFIILATDGVWDVLSNKEAVDIVASAPGRTTAARALVDCAVRAWRLKYPTSKNDDCAVVCLFLDNVSSAVMEEDDRTRNNAEASDKTEIAYENVPIDDTHDFVLQHSGTLASSNEIVPVSEVTEEEEKSPVSKRSLAECLSTADDEEWSALEGVTRVNSLLSLPRFLSGERSWRKWL